MVCTVVASRGRSGFVDEAEAHLINDAANAFHTGITNR